MPCVQLTRQNVLKVLVSLAFFYFLVTLALLPGYLAKIFNCSLRDKFYDSFALYLRSARIFGSPPHWGHCLCPKNSKGVLVVYFTSASGSKSVSSTPSSPPKAFYFCSFSLHFCNRLPFYLVSSPKCRIARFVISFTTVLHSAFAPLVFLGGISAEDTTCVPRIPKVCFLFTSGQWFQNCKMHSFIAS